MLELFGPPLPKTAEQKIEADRALAEAVKKFFQKQEDFIASPEGLARSKLMERLKEMTTDETIAQSETCVELLEAFHDSLDYNFWRADSGGVISHLKPHFDAEKSAAAGRARAEKQAKEDAPYREFLAKHPSKAPKEQKILLRKEFKLTAAEAHGAVRRWKESDEGKKLLTATGSRQLQQVKTHQKEEGET